MLQDSSEEKLKSEWEKHGQEERENIKTELAKYIMEKSRKVIVL